MAAARRIVFESINADLIYGLPKQTPESFARTVAQVSELRPDRIALYAYAHLPQRFKPQRRIVIEQLPPPDHRVAMLGGAMVGFVGARPGADPRRAGAPGDGDGADVPGPGGVRIDRTVVPDQGARRLQARARQPGRVAGSGPVHAGARPAAGHRHRLVLRAGGGHGVRPPPARRSAARALLAHHSGSPAWTRRCCSARC